MVGDSIKQLATLPVALADDVVGGAARGAYSLLRNPIEDAGRAVLGMPDRATPSAASSAPQTPSLREPSTRSSGDATGPGMDRKLGDEFSNRSIQLRNPDGQVRKVGNSYSGGNVTGDVSLVDANGQALSGRMRGGVSVLGNAQDAARTSASLRNPDGSYWSAGDNAIMAANLRDGVDPYLGTSRAQGDTANQDLLRLATSPGKVGSSFARQMLLNQVGDQTTRRGQDITSADSRYDRELTAQTSRNKLRYDMDKDQRDYQTGRSDKAFEQSQAADKAWTEHANTLFVTNFHVNPSRRPG